jgi:putative thiamine-phosphate diphosphorylase
VRNARGYDYITFSPVFPSISKPEYKPAYTEDEISEMLKQASTPVIALGGVTQQMIPFIENMGFAGYAMLGAIWQNNNGTDDLNI